MTWDHARGFDPMVATSEAYEKAHPGVSIRWEKRSLQAFADRPIEEMADRYDLMVIDHPHVGEVAGSGLLMAFDGVGRDADLATLATQSVGLSHASYNFGGRQRALQLERSGQWTKGKSCDNFGQLGPWLVSRDEIADPQDLSMWLTLNGAPMQQGSTRTMVFGVAHLVSHLSHFMTLHPGDVISTGTPPGVGMGQKPPRYLRPGDKVAFGIDGLGVQRQTAIADPEGEDG